MFEILILAITGAAVGILGYLLGLGGGVLIVPVLVIGFKYPVHEAVATSLLAITATSITISAKNVPIGLVNIKLAVELELVTIFGAVAGSFLGVNLHAKILTFAFASILIFTAVVMLLKKDPSETFIKDDEHESVYRGKFFDQSKNEEIVYDIKNIGSTYAVSAAAGFISGLLGFGGGVFKVPAMNIISKVPIKAATATSNFMIGFTAAAGSVAYITAGYVSPVTACMLVCGITAGSWYATSRLRKVADKKIQKIFVIFVTIVAIQMIIKAL